MCHACVTGSIARRMMSRRDLFRATPAAAVAAIGPAAIAQAPSTVVDLTHTLRPEFPTYGGDPGIAMTQQFSFAEHGYNLFEITLDEHTGTHIDAPLHFSADGQAVEEIPVESLICPLCIIDIRERAAGDPDAMVMAEDIAAWVERNGAIPDGACVAMLSGWRELTETPRFRGEVDGVQHYPGFHADAARLLLEETNAVGLAVDTLSLDIGASQSFDTHYAWLPANRWGLECVANLDALPEAGATLIVGSPKHRGGSGGPSRVLALV